MAKGWRNQSRRHSLASKGIKTAQKMPRNLIVKKDRYDRRINQLEKLLKQDLKFPYEDKRYDKKYGATTSQFFGSKSDIKKAIMVQKNYQKGLDECLVCSKWKKKGSNVRLDKREAGDGLMGSAFVCEKCANQYE